MADVLIVLRLVVACVFLVAASSKLRRPRTFAEQLTVYVRASATQRRLLAWGVIAVEGALALSYGFGTFSIVTTAVGLLTTAVFALLVTRRLSRGEGGPCLCFGANDGDAIGPRTLVRIALLAAAQLALSADVIRSTWTGAAAAPSWTSAPHDPSSAIAWAIGGVGTVAWMLRSPDVIDQLAIFLRRRTKAAGASLAITEQSSL